MNIVSAAIEVPERYWSAVSQTSTYSSVHRWLRDNYGYAGVCQNCGYKTCRCHRW